MELTRALRLQRPGCAPRVAFVGAGGKTTALFQAARGLSPPVLLTCTAHLAVEQLAFADAHFFEDELPADADFPAARVLVTGPVEGASGRALGVNPATLERLHALSAARRIPLLIEADGSRRLPLKAPASHEPPIPEFVDTVVVVAGLSALGQPLTPETVHRPQIFADLADLRPGAILTPEALTRVLRHPRGGLKNIPAGARRVALLNQADTPELQAIARRMAPALLPAYDAVLVSGQQRIAGSRQRSGVSRQPSAVSGQQRATFNLQPSTFNLQHPTPNLQFSVFAAHESVAAVILAAGGSRRYGRPKQLLDWGGRPLVWHVARRAVEAGLSPVAVVCGEECEQIRAVLRGLPVQIVPNPAWTQGQATSVRAGVEAVSARSGGILFLLADQPRVPVPLLRTLVEAHAQSLDPVIGPLYDGRRGNPVLFDQVTFADLRALSGDTGGRALFSRYPPRWVPWLDDRARLDVDSPEDYRRLLEEQP